MKTLMTCPLCGYSWWMDAIGDMPDPNCPRCFPSNIVYSTSSTTTEPTPTKRLDSYCGDRLCHLKECPFYPKPVRQGKKYHLIVDEFAFWKSKPKRGRPKWSKNKKKYRGTLITPADAELIHAINNYETYNTIEPLRDLLNKVKPQPQVRPCEKTVSGEHIWKKVGYWSCPESCLDPELYCRNYHRPTWKVTEVKCVACGLIDDTKGGRLKKIKENITLPREGTYPWKPQIRPCENYVSIKKENIEGDFEVTITVKGSYPKCPENITHCGCVKIVLSDVRARRTYSYCIHGKQEVDV